jgi:hypothetical protein
VLVTCWADVPGPSSSVNSWLQPWQQCWQPSEHRLAIVVISSDRSLPIEAKHLARQRLVCLGRLLWPGPPVSSMVLEGMR